MAEKRYLVYMASSYADVVNERLKVEYTLLNSKVIPWEFSERRNSLNTAKARQQIDDSDYVIFLLSGRYGDLSASGISYLNLDFLYALNKNKTIISLIDAFPEKKLAEEQEINLDLIKKLNCFRETLKKDSNYYHEYANILDLERATKSLLSRAILEKPALGWVRPQGQNLVGTTNTNTSLNSNTNNNANASEIERLKKQVADLEKKLAASTKVVASEKKYESHTFQVKPTQQINNTASNSGDDAVQIQYRAHAYQDGNLHDIYPKREMSWEQILQVLAPHFKKPVLESTFIRVMNDYLESTALEDARTFYPRAHAVARTQIDARCIQQIKLQMKWNNWIVPQQENLTSTRVYWALTQEGQKCLLALFA